MMSLAGASAADVLVNPAGWLRGLSAGLSAAGVGLVISASVGLAKGQCKDQTTSVLCLTSASIAYSYQSNWIFPLLIAIGGLATLFVNRSDDFSPPVEVNGKIEYTGSIPRTMGSAFLVAIAMGISSSISGQGVPPSSSARSAKLYMRPGRTSFLSAYDSMHLSAWRSAYSFSSRQRSQPVEDPGHLPHGFFDFFLFPERGMGMRSHVVKYLSHSGLQPRGELGELLLLRRPMPRRLLLQRRLLRRLLLLRRPMPRRLLLLRRPMPRRLLLLRRPMPRRLLLLRRLLLRRPMLQRRLLLRRPMPRRLLLQRRLLLRRLLLGSSVLM